MEKRPQRIKYWSISTKSESKASNPPDNNKEEKKEQNYIGNKNSKF